MAKFFTFYMTVWIDFGKKVIISLYINCQYFCASRCRKTVGLEKERTGLHIQAQGNMIQKVSLLRALEPKREDSLHCFHPFSVIFIWKLIVGIA